jgi:predicted transcriptional regulator
MDQVSRKRDRLEVIFDILNIVRNHNNSIKPTPLLRYSNLSSQRFSEYLVELMDKDFIKEVVDRKEKKFITLTDKGFRYLEKYVMIQGFIGDFEL